MRNIAVIGGGVIGITSAIQIQKDVRNVQVTIYADKLSPDTTGDVSAGFWSPYLLEHTDEHDVMRWSKVTHEILHNLWKAGYAEQAGICLLPVLKLLTEKHFEIPKWLKIPFGSIQLTSEQLDKLSSEHGTKYTGGLHFVTFTCEPTKLLPLLMQQFLKNGGNIIHKKINNLSELSHYDAIINCAGLEARQLTADTELHAVRGQISRVKAPWQLQIISNESMGANYIIPNTSCVILGGTEQVGNENMTVSPEDKEHIFKGCIKIAAGLKVCKEHLDAVGLRPGRSKVRLELENTHIGNKTLPVLHNYGHGGAGVTLSFGCAKDISALLQNELNSVPLLSHL